MLFLSDAVVQVRALRRWHRAQGCSQTHRLWQRHADRMVAAVRATVPTRAERRSFGYSDQAVERIGDGRAPCRVGSASRPQRLLGGFHAAVEVSLRHRGTETDGSRSAAAACTAAGGVRDQAFW